MDSAVTPKPPQRRHGRFLRRVGSALIWTIAVVLGAFGLYFTFANYPWFGVAAALLIILLLVYSERQRRAAQKARETARTRNRLSP